MGRLQQPRSSLTPTPPNHLVRQGSPAMPALQLPWVILPVLLDNFLRASLRSEVVLPSIPRQCIAPAFLRRSTDALRLPWASVLITPHTVSPLAPAMALPRPGLGSPPRSRAGPGRGGWFNPTSTPASASRPVRHGHRGFSRLEASGAPARQAPLFRRSAAPAVPRSWRPQPTWRMG